MLQCLTPNSNSSPLPHSPSPPPPYQGNSSPSTNETPGSSSQTSPNLHREYRRALQSNSYNEIWSTIHVVPSDPEDSISLPVVQLSQEDEENTQRLRLDSVLNPNRQRVEEALSRAKRDNLTRLVSSYFDHSENTTLLCLLLDRCVFRIRSLYNPLHELLEVLPVDSHSLDQSQCNWASEVFLKFDSFGNPFSDSDSQNFDDIRFCFSQLKQQLDRRLRKSKSIINLLCRASAGFAVGSIASNFHVAGRAVSVTLRAIARCVAGPGCTTFPPSRNSQKKIARKAQLDAASTGTFVLNNHLATIDCLVARLRTAVEDDKRLIRMGLEGGGERYTIQEVVKQLRKKHLNVQPKLKALEEHLCLCSNSVNRARARLLEGIYLHQTFFLGDGRQRHGDELAPNLQQNFVYSAG
ncbi:hypothetical protein UlMin_013920 [Ulmus minor]